MGEPQLLICLYDEPLLHVDLKFVALPDLVRRVENPHILWQADTLVSDVLQATAAHFPPAPSLQWVEDRFWMHYATTKLGRGELLEVVSMLDFLRITVFGPLLAQQCGQPARGVRKLEQLVPPEALLPVVATVPAYERGSCLASLHQAVASYQALRQAIRPAGFVEKTRVEARTLISSRRKYDFLTAAASHYRARRVLRQNPAPAGPTPEQVPHAEGMGLHRLRHRLYRDSRFRSLCRLGPGWY